MTINTQVTEKGQHEISYPKMCSPSRYFLHPKQPVVISITLPWKGGAHRVLQSSVLPAQFLGEPH